MFSKNSKMEDTRVLFISQEIFPYLPESEISTIGRYLPQGIQDKGCEIRTFMPRFGCVNERRNQLHEVIRLSGMNLVIDDTDHPLIIKVASIQSARMQVYFIDNEDYFQRKTPILNETGMPYDDNDERAVFFSKGVVETVRKLRWSPNIVHCHGWMTAFAPLIIKRAFSDDPLFAKSKIVYSVYNDDFGAPLSSTIRKKIAMDGINRRDIEILKDPSYLNLTRLAIAHSDAVIIGSKTLRPDVMDYIGTLKKPVLKFSEDSNYIESYYDFYQKLMVEPDTKKK